MHGIRPLAPTECPHCGAKDTLYIENRGIRCRLCGYQQKTEPGRSEKPAAPPRRFKASYSITHRGELDPWARAAYDTGQDHIRREDYTGALKAFYRALEYQSDFIDAHFWVALLEADPAIKRDHLTTILAHDPNHIEALRELMVLDGRMSPEEAARTHHHDEPQEQAVGMAVGAQTTALKCPVCAGDLTVSADLKRVECRYCGHSAPHTAPQANAGNSLAAALLERKAQPVRWIIGERLLHCNNCGAERTIPATKLSMRCMFCGSNHVIEQDALASFQQPEGLVPFRVSQEAAAEALQSRLAGWGERIKGWFDNNKVAHSSIEGVYLPFWVFDAFVDVTQTTVDKRMSQGRSGPVRPITRVNIAELVNNIPVCAVKSPPRSLTAKLGRYDLQARTAYRPELLAKFPAELYSIDFDKASLQAREVIGKAMREKYGQAMSSEVEVSVFSGVKQMSFSLLLLPVWIATLIEQDGDVRLALVNGQTGQVALGSAQKRKRR